MNRQNIIRSRQNSRRNLIQSSTTAATSVYMDEGRSSTLSYNGNKIESTNQIRRRGPTEQTLVTQTTRGEENSLGNVTDTSKDTVVDDVVIANQFRRSSTQSTMEKIPTIRTRGNIKTRTKPIDLAASGTINTMTTSIREETTIKTVDVRNSRRLRYKSRPSQTDTNLTGEGLVTSKIMQKIDSSTNQNEKKPTNFTIPNNDVKDATDKSVLSNSPKRHIVVKRPHKSNGEHHTAVVTKTKISEEISEDDNYPESFKALLQAKNATHISSPSGESLSVKASQKVSKTHPTPIQQFQTGPDKDNVSRLRKKLKKDQNNESVLDKQIDLPVSTNYSSSESPKTKSFDYKPRGTYLPRNKSQRVNNLRLESSSTFRPASEGPYKFSRKFKASTTPTPNTDAILKTKRVESNSEPKKPVVRSSLYTRKNNPFKESTKEPVNRKNDRVQSESFFKPRGATLPRTSYYSKQYLQRNISLSPESTSLNDVLNDSNSKIADKKSDDSPGFPLIFTSSNNSDENFIVNTKKVDNGYSMNNKETYDNNTERSNVNSIEESEKNLATDVTTQKYHANYKAKLDSSYIDKNTSVTTPTITNFRTKNYGRKSANFQEKQQTINNLKERNQRKIGGKISKTTEVPENSIAPEPEKPKNKFSSKYRASNIDRPFYKPTVPTVTPSTVEGEEIQLGPDMNAIAFTRTRGQLSSADLRLSESLAKPLQVLNVEASNHSPSVTVSIFDALAEILTSTPKPRLSSTTEVLPKQNVDESVNVSLDGVSSNINVNTDTGLANKDTMNAQDIVSTSAINVQTTEAIKSNVFNSLLVGENVTPPIKEENQNTFSTSSHPTTFPTPTTPLSARKPFAIRVLYSDTVTPKYDMTTAATTTNSKSTDNATMVYNTVSDLLLSNNKLVSTELTSMLTNNIKSIIDSLDEESKSRLSVDMTKILNSMIPEASRKIPTTVSTLIPDTTPYSMEDINDTANINIDDDDDDKSYNGISQVSSTLQDVENINSVNSRTTENPLHVYSSQASETAHKSEHEDTTTTMYNIDIIPFPKSQNDFRTNGSPTENMSFDSNSNYFDKQVLSPLFTPNIKINKLYESNNAQNNLDKVSDIELWILSKKARVLKMIEDILREHNDEISNPPLQSFNISDISFSSRLSEIMTTMNQKTRNTDLPDSITTKQDITPITPNSPSTLFTSSNVIQEISSMTSTELMAPDPKLVPTTESIIEMSSQTGTAISNTQSVETSTQYNESNDNLLATTESFIDDIKMPESVSGINFRNFIMDSSTTQVIENDSVSISTTGSPFDSMKIEENIATESDLNNNIVDDGTTTQIIFNEVFSITTAASPIETIKMLENVTTETDSNNYSSSTTQMTINDDIYITTTVPQINNLKLDENVTERDVENITENFFTPEVITNPDSVENATTENILMDSSFMSTTTENDLEALQKSGIKSTTTFVSQVNSSNELVTVSNQIKMSPQSSIPRKDYFIFGILPNNTVTKQIRTEKPKDANGNTIFKFIPIEDVTVTPQDSNVLKLASPKNSKATDKNNQITTVSATTELHTQTPQVQNNLNNNIEVSTSLVEDAVGTPLETTSESISERPQIIITTVNTDATTENQKYSTVIQTVPSTISVPDTTTESFTAKTTTLISTTDLASVSSIQEIVELPTNPSTSPIPSISETPTALPISTSDPQNTPFALQTERIPKKIPGFDNNKYVNAQVEENAKLLQALLLATSDENQSSKKKIKVGMKEESTTSRSLEEELKQFEEDTKLLKALLQATGRSPDSLKISSLNDIKAIVTTTPTERPTTQQTTTTQRILSTIQTTTQSKIQATITTPSSIDNDIKKLQEDTLLLQALLKAAGTKNEQNIPIISGLTSNVRMSSKILNSSTKSIPTTPLNIRPVYTTTPSSMSTSMKSQGITVSTLQPSTEDIRISTTYQPVTTKNIASPLTTTIRPDTTTEIPSSSTFSDEEDLQFLQNLKSVLSTNNNNMDPETALANRVIALAVERSLSDIQVGKNAEPTKVITSTTPTTTIRTTTTRLTTTTSRPNIPSIEEDIKQFEQDTKLLQALLKATGQDPSKLNLPTLPILNTPALEKINPNNRGTATATVKPYGAQIAVKDELRNESDDAKLLQTLKQLQDVQETTTTRSKLAITGQTSDEALKKLINKGQNPGMVSEATKSSASLSTEYGNTNDALLAALLKEQGFGPTTASSLDEQLRLAALLNQVVVTPKVRRTTTLPPPPPAPRRPILDGLAWLWQQWRETGPGSAPPRPSRPAPSDKPQTPSTATSSRVNWFGSGPFVGNADERPASNRIPLEPPSAVSQGPGRGQLVSAAINVTRAFSQFLGAAIQGAAKTVQNVFRAGQQAATDVYSNGSGPA
ncbi:mucin-5AC-like isoform X3 [Leptidea sinapis]|uniref:mucin-5AC-like isoform X3 n=1 Tax=Leptidea sinapis TaxID=189913 RepID=UPI0021C3C211|nr:mucin-5AC-like isoform X3 [Leptidea sinapis]